MKKYITLLLILFISGTGFAQEMKIMTAGDPAPKIQYSKWLKGTPFSPDQKDMIYVFEFWATWCGPCIAAMPHLSELARKYTGKVQVVGVNVWEKIKDKPYESAIPEVEKFVNNSRDRMDYNVIVDNNARYMSENWLLAAGQQGIPATIVVKNGVIQWIGHPNTLDGPLDSLVNGTFNLERFKDSYAKKQLALSQQKEQMGRILKAVKVAAEIGDFDQLSKVIDEGIKEAPYLKGGLQSIRFQAMLTEKSPQEAFDYAEMMLKSFPGYRLDLAMIVIDKGNLERESYLKAIEWLNSIPNKSSMILEIISDGYVKADDMKNALATIEAAVVKGEKELGDEKYTGRISVRAVDGYKRKVKEIKGK
jgi:thiol-disulfide isomerase/thioredoxin